MRSPPYVFSLCYLRDYLQNRSPHKYSGDASDTLQLCATLCISFGRSSLGEDKLADFARILLLLTLTLAGGCFQLHSIFKKDSDSFPLRFLFPFSSQWPRRKALRAASLWREHVLPLPSLDFSLERSIQVHQEIFLKPWSFAFRKCLILKFIKPHDGVLLTVDTMLYCRSLELS